MTDSSSSSSEADEGMQETPLSKRSKHGATEEENSDSDTNPVDSSQSKSPSSSSSEEEQVIEKKKCKMGLKHGVDRKHAEKHGVKHKYEKNVIREVHEI